MAPGTGKSPIRAGCRIVPRCSRAAYSGRKCALSRSNASCAVPLLVQVAELARSTVLSQCQRDQRPKIKPRPLDHYPVEYFAAVLLKGVIQIGEELLNKVLACVCGWSGCAEVRSAPTEKPFLLAFLSTGVLALPAKSFAQQLLHNFDRVRLLLRACARQRSDSPMHRGARYPRCGGDAADA